MKKIIYLLFATLIIACNNTNDTKINYGIYSGTFKNGVVSDLMLSAIDGSVEKNINVNPNGTFTDTITQTNKLYVLSSKTLNSGLNLYLQPGENIHLDIKGNKLSKNVIYTGEGAANQIYLAEKSKTKINLEDLYRLNEKDFVKALDGLVENYNKLLSKSNVTQNLKTKEERDLNFWKLLTLNEYSYAHKGFTNDTLFDTSEDFKKIANIDQLDYNNYQDLEYSYSYSRLLLSHFSTKADALEKDNKDNLGYGLLMLKSLASLSNKDVKNFLAYKVTSLFISNAPNVDALYKSFLAISTNKKNNANITEIYNSIKSLANGSPSPTFQNYKNIDGSTTSLSDLKGKYVYIDIWATWCAPCIKEIPFLKDIEKQYHNKNIAFVSISLDAPSQSEYWEKMVKEQQLEGIQLIADNAYNSDFIKAYEIMGIPRFILIDPDGIIIDKNAPRPSDPKLKDLFTSLKI